MPLGRRSIALGQGPRRAFTLVELLIAVAILALLAAVAMPVLSSYVRRSYTTEAIVNLTKIYAGVMAYYEQDHTTRAGLVPSLKLPDSAPAVPATIPRGTLYLPTLADWDDPTWQVLDFMITSRMRYQFQYCLGDEHVNPVKCIDSTLDPTRARFIVISMGDLNGNGVPSLFLREGLRGVGSDIAGGPIFVYSAEE